VKRRTLKHLRPKPQPEHHHNVYVVLLDPAVGKTRKARATKRKSDPKKPCVYVGMTGLTPEERFENHKAGIKDAWVVKRYGIRLLPEQGRVHGHGRALRVKAQESGGNWYYCPQLDIEGWLCPALFKYFEKAPAE
jgi:hypothetical protein